MLQCKYNSLFAALFWDNLCMPEKEVMEQGNPHCDYHPPPILLVQ